MTNEVLQIERETIKRLNDFYTQPHALESYRLEIAEKIAILLEERIEAVKGQLSMLEQRIRKGDSYTFASDVVKGTEEGQLLLKIDSKIRRLKAVATILGDIYANISK